ncbi:MAG: ribonuclease HII [Pseudomonadota bacterium]
MPDYSEEKKLVAAGALRIAGIDEVGRGPLAGPVVAAAVILDRDSIPEGLNDSKKLTAKTREALFDKIQDRAHVSIASASVEEIDTLNILYASHLAMERALAGLESVDHALVDGNMIPAGITCPATPMIKGDGRSVSIAAASIMAKVTRDRLMVDLAQQCPGYGWERNAGYPTKEHRDALNRLGVTPHHRRSFRTVHNML